MTIGTIILLAVLVAIGVGSMLLVINALFRHRSQQPLNDASVSAVGLGIVVLLVLLAALVIPILIVRYG